MFTITKRTLVNLIILMFVYLQILQDYKELTHVQKQLTIEWPKYKTAILQLSASKPTVSHILETITDDLNEGMVAYK